eukprot:9094470-Pyramimonas_sp.AAC.1
MDDDKRKQGGTRRASAPCSFLDVLPAPPFPPRRSSPDISRSPSAAGLITRPIEDLNRAT